MARMARIVIPGVPHHVTQRGNRRQDVFFEEADYRHYLWLLERYVVESGSELLAYCLMPNHVHLILVPSTEVSLTASVQETHRRYTQAINQKKDWKGYLWQGRYASFPMDEAHLLAAARYIELNPVRAGLVSHAQDWSWSSVHAHISGESPPAMQALNVAPLLGLRPDWSAFLKEGLSEEEVKRLRDAERTGRPVGTPSFIDELERLTGRSLRKRKPGPKTSKP
jgi:putative transposase